MSAAGGCGGPYVCPYPLSEAHARGARWTCPGCGSRYRMTRRIPARWWRYTYAPDGYWRLALADRIRLAR